MKKLFFIFLSLLILIFNFFYLAPNETYASPGCDIAFCTPSECADSRCNSCDFCLLCDAAFCTPTDCGEQRCWGCGFCDPDRCDIAYCTPAECGETRCRDCSFCTGPVAGTCTCELGIPSGPGSCPVNIGSNNCSSGYLPSCPSSVLCSSGPPSCSCEPTVSLDCGEENEECCPGDVCSIPLECTGVGYGYSRCLRQCSDTGDCNPGEICNAYGGCVSDPFSNGDGGGLSPALITCPGGAKGIDTAIGCIPLEDTNEFAGFFIGWGIRIAGGVAFLLIVFAGFQITTSGGDPKKLQAGRELLTAAIAGLLLLIFSVFLLRLVGVNILGLPSFGS